jgi:hypothetical protein
MSLSRSLFLLGATTSLAFAALDRPWQVLTDPTAAEAAAKFAHPPPDYSAQFTWGWGRGISREVIAHDLDAMKALGVHAAAVEPKSGLPVPYLSEGWFELVRIGVEEARKRDMRLWFMDDGDYPSGLAGGKFTTEAPELRMQGLAAPERVAVPPGGTFSRAAEADVVCAVALEKTSGAVEVLPLAAGKLEWRAPAQGDWEVVLTRRVYRTMPTRSANNPANVKDATHSLMDYLDPAATKRFVAWTFDAYAKAIGDELGKTVLGFRGDEPGYGFNPWTPRLFEEFQQRKGYDLRRYVHAFTTGSGARAREMSAEARRAYADYCDVWSDLFRDHYCNAEAEWCAAHGVEFQLHIEHEEILPQLALSNGDFFKCMRETQVPGIDIIWHQIWMDNPADFPKLASSAAHLYGRPRAMCEAFAAYQPAPNVKQARWLLDHLFTRGISRIEYMYWPAGGRMGAAGAPQDGTAAASVPGRGGGPRYYREPDFPKVAAYANRLSYLLGEGRPAAQIGVYLPSSSFWLVTPQQGLELGNQIRALGHALIEHQRDFDYVDEQALASVLKLRGDRLVNASGQGYRTIIVPPALAISRVALDRLQAFAKAGGRVILIGAAPASVVERTFLEARGPADVSWATLHETEVALTPAVLAQLPAPDLALERPNALVSYAHRRLRDADLYFIFNSGDEPLATQATLAGAGAVQAWDPETGAIRHVEKAAAGAARGTVRVPLALAPWSTVLLVVGGAAGVRAGL